MKSIEDLNREISQFENQLKHNASLTAAQKLEVRRNIEASKLMLVEAKKISVHATSHDNGGIVDFKAATDKLDSEATQFAKPRPSKQSGFKRFVDRYILCCMNKKPHAKKDTKKALLAECDDESSVRRRMGAK